MHPPRSHGSGWWGGLGLATLTGALCFLACTPFDLSALAWVAALPVIVAIDRAPSMRQALGVGWWAGIVAHAGGFYWLVAVLQRFASLPLVLALLIFVAFCLYQGTIMLLFALLLRVLRRRTRAPFALLVPLLLTSCEFALPQIFPCGLFITQAWQPHVIQIAELTGPFGVTALLTMIAGALYDAINAQRLFSAPLLVAGGVLLAALGFGVVRMAQIDASQVRSAHVKVGVVQPNFPYRVHARYSAQEAQAQLAALQAQTRRLEAAGAQLGIWSEGSYPFKLPRHFANDYPAESPLRIRRDTGLPVLIGGLTADHMDSEAFNSALLVDRNGAVTGRYDKVRLLAFGEHIPEIEYFPWLRRQLPEGAGRFTPGSSPQILLAGGLAQQPLRFAPVICYEDILPGYLRKVGALHPDLLVNLTSDAWFGARTEPWQHLALAVFASIELRTGMVRAVNSGVSAYIDANGRVIDETYAVDPYLDPKPADSRVFSVAILSGGHTFFAIYGNIFVYGCMLLAAFLALRGAGSRA